MVGFEKVKKVHFFSVQMEGERERERINSFYLEREKVVKTF